MTLFSPNSLNMSTMGKMKVGQIERFLSIVFYVNKVPAAPDEDVYPTGTQYVCRDIS